MRNLKLVLLAAAMFGAASMAHAGAGSLKTTVAPVTTNVTYSVVGPPALDTVVGYTVEIKNDGGNTINNIRFTGSASVTDAAETLLFLPDATVGATCTQVTPPPPPAPANPVSIQCTVGTGQLGAGQSFPTFAVFFKAPVKVVNGVADDVPPDNVKDFVKFSGTTFYAEGTGGTKSKPVNSTGAWSATDVLLGTNNPDQVKSAITKNGGSLFTAAIDVHGTSITVPPIPSFADASIKEDEAPDPGLCVNFTKCFQSDIAVIDTSAQTINFAPNLLKVLLSAYAPNIKNGTKPENVLIFYNGNPVQWLCPDPNVIFVGGVQQIPTPCLSSATGDWKTKMEFVLYNTENGTWTTR